MSTRIYPIDFLGNGAMLTPLDPELHDAAVDFCRRELVEDINLSHLAKVWIAKNGADVLGIMGYVLKPDVPVFRAIDPLALRLLAQRYNNFLADNGARGKETFIHIARREKPEQRCPDWNVVLREWGAKSADRVSVTVR